MAEIRDDHQYMMPAHFGGMPGPRQAGVYHDTRALTAFYETDEAALQALLPPGFVVARPEVMVSVMENRGVEWMGGEPYDILAVNAAARFEGGEDRIEGWFSLVVWENKATPILPGREQTGIPKVFGEVEAIRFDGDRTEARTWSHYGGHTHCELHATGLRPATDEEAGLVRGGFGRMEWLGHRYIPAPVQGATLSEATLFPQEFEIGEVMVGGCEVFWSPPPLHKNPTQAHIVAQLAALPDRGPARPAVWMQTKCILRGDQARVLA